MQAFLPGIVVGFLIAVFMAPDNEKVVEVYPQSYYKETNIQQSVCKGPFDIHLVGSEIESQVITDLTNR